jgi:hypothetical protein
VFLQALTLICGDARGSISIFLARLFTYGVILMFFLVLQALGADAVLLGRPILWGLAVEGEEGVTRVLEEIRVELECSMRASGLVSLDHVNADLLAHRNAGCREE